MRKSLFSIPVTVLLLFASCILLLMAAMVLFTDHIPVALLTTDELDTYLYGTIILVLAYFVYAFIQSLLLMLERRTSQTYATHYRLLDSMAIGVAVLIKGKVVFYNEQAARLLSIDTRYNSCLGVPWQSFVSKDLVPAVHKFFALAVKRPNSTRFYPIRLQFNGRQAEVTVSVRSMVFENKPAIMLLLQKTGGLGRLACLTEAKERAGQDLLAAITTVVFQTDRAGCIRWLNPAWAALSGRGVPDSLGRPLLAYIPEDDQPLVREALLSSPRVWEKQGTVVTRLLRAGGSDVWVELHYRRHLNRHGTPCISGAFTNISLRKRADDLLEAGNRSLLSLVEHLPGMIYRCRNDEQWTMEYVSSRCYEVTGYESYALLNNMQVAYIDLVYPEDRARVWQEVHDAVAAGRIFAIDYRIITPLNQLRAVKEYGKGIYSASGDLLAIEGFIIPVADTPDLHAVTDDLAVVGALSKPNRAG